MFLDILKLFPSRLRDVATPYFHPQVDYVYTYVFFICLVFSFHFKNLQYCEHFLLCAANLYTLTLGCTPLCFQAIVFKHFAWCLSLCEFKHGSSCATFAWAGDMLSCVWASCHVVLVPISTKTLCILTNSIVVVCLCVGTCLRGIWMELFI